MTEIKWQEPPASGHGRGGSDRWSKVADQLRNRPGAWALVAEGVGASTTDAIKRGRIKAFAQGEFDATSRNGRFDERGVRVHDIYARFVGEVTR